MSTAGLLGEVMICDDQLAKVADQIQNEIDDATIANQQGTVDALTARLTRVTNAALMYNRRKIKEIDDSPEVQAATAKLRGANKTIKDIFEKNKKIAENLTIVTAAIGVVEQVGKKFIPSA